MTDVPKGKVPVKVGPGDIRYVDAKVGPDGQVKILPPRRPKIIVKPSVNTTIPNPRILASVAPVARNLVLRTAKVRDPEPYAFGISLVRPLVIAADDSGEYLVLDLLWSVGEVEGVCNGVGSWTHSLNIGDLGIKNVSDTSLHEHFVGTAGQAASTIMTALKGSYDALPGKAHSVISLQQGWNLNLWGATSGVHVADPRTSPHTVAFTENPALILADVFDRCGYPINWASVADAADYCDEIVSETTSPGEKRWEVGGVIQDRNSLQYWVHALAQYANCYVDIRGSSSGGEVILIPDKPRSSNHTVTAASIVEGSERLTYRGSRDAPEQVIVNYGNNGYNFSVDYGTSGGPGTESTLQMPFWDDGRNAGRKARETYNKANNAIESLEFIGWDDGLIRTLGDVGTVTLSSVGLSSQLMALVENEPVQRGRWKRRYIEYNASNYIDEFGGTVSTSGSDTINNPYNPPAGPTPTLTAELVTTTSPNYYRIKIEFSPVTWAYLQDYKINVYQDGVSPQPVLHSEYVAKGSEAGSPLTITVYADLNDSPGFQMAIGTSPQTVYRVDIYNRSLWTDQEGGEILSSTPGTATVTDPLSIKEGLQAWWSFDEASGTRYNSHATASPALYRFEPRAYNYPSSPWTIDGGSVGSTPGVLTTSSPLALAAQIDTSSPADWLSTYFDSADGIATATSFTIAGWVKMDTVDVVQGIMRKGNINDFADFSTTDDWILYYSKQGFTSPQIWSLRFITRTTGTDKTVTAAAPLVAGQWHYICCWFEEAVGVGMSLDGVTIGTSLITQSPAPPLEQRFNAIHAGLYQISAFGPQFPLNGALDEWGFWNRALSEEEITYLYNSGAGRAYTDLP